MQYHNNIHNQTKYMAPGFGGPSSCGTSNCGGPSCGVLSWRFPMQEQYGTTPYSMPHMMHPGEYSSFQQKLTTAADNIYTYPNNLPGALELIKEAVLGEAEDRNFYEFLISVAPTKEEKLIIKGIMEDEIEHSGLFRQIYFELTGQMLPAPKESKIKKPSSYCEGIKNALTGEQNTAYKYAKILFAMVHRVHMMKLVKIITDELRHVTQYNYIYSKNRCR